MIQSMIRDLGGVEVFGAISICLFFLVFGGTLIWAFRLKRPFLTTMESLPLRDDETDVIQKGASRHE